MEMALLLLFGENWCRTEKQSEIWIYCVKSHENRLTRQDIANRTIASHLNPLIRLHLFDICIQSKWGSGIFSFDNPCIYMARWCPNSVPISVTPTVDNRFWLCDQVKWTYKWAKQCSFLSNQGKRRQFTHGRTNNNNAPDRYTAVHEDGARFSNNPSIIFVKIIVSVGKTIDFCFLI